LSRMIDSSFDDASMHHQFETEVLCENVANKKYVDKQKRTLHPKTAH
jgi:hypothetical protein